MTKIVKIHQHQGTVSATKGASEIPERLRFACKPPVYGMPSDAYHLDHVFYGKMVKITDKNNTLIFEKNRTRSSRGFEAAAYDQDVHGTYIGTSGTHVGHKESMKVGLTR